MASSCANTCCDRLPPPFRDPTRGGVRADTAVAAHRDARWLRQQLVGRVSASSPLRQRCRAACLRSRRDPSIPSVRVASTRGRATSDKLKLPARRRRPTMTSWRRSRYRKAARRRRCFPRDRRFVRRGMPLPALAAAGSSRRRHGPSGPPARGLLRSVPAGVAIHDESAGPLPHSPGDSLLVVLKRRGGERARSSWVTPGPRWRESAAASSAWGSFMCSQAIPDLVSADLGWTGAVDRLRRFSVTTCMSRARAHRDRPGGAGGVRGRLGAASVTAASATAPHMLPRLFPQLRVVRLTDAWGDRSTSADHPAQSGPSAGGSSSGRGYSARLGPSPRGRICGAGARAASDTSAGDRRTEPRRFRPEPII